MNKFFAVLIVIFLVFYFAARAKHRKANKLRNGQCGRCGAVLASMEWELISAAGGPLAGAEARACSRCTRRFSLVRTVTWIMLGIALAATIALLVLPDIY